jgi:hypothetical protein
MSYDTLIERHGDYDVEAAPAAQAGRGRRRGRTPER